MECFSNVCIAKITDTKHLAAPLGMFSFFVRMFMF